MGYTDRRFRCLFSHLNTPSLQKVFPYSTVRGSTTVQSTSNGVKHFSQSFHQGSTGHGKNVEKERHTNPLLPRRLASEKPRSNLVTATNPVHSGSMYQVRVDHKPEEVQTDTNSSDHLCRSGVSATSGSGPPSGAQTGKSGRNNQTYYTERSSSSSSVGISSRSDGLSHETDQAGSSTSQTSSENVTNELGPTVSALGPTSSPSRLVNPSSVLVVGPQEHKTRSDSETVPADNFHLHRRQSGGVRSHSGVIRADGSLVTRAVKDALQQQGNVGGTESSRTFPEPDQKSGCVDLLRQHNNHSHNQQTGRHKIMATDRTGGAVVGDAGQSQLRSESPSHSRQIKCHRRPVVKEVSSNLNRMDVEQRSPVKSLEQVEQTKCRPVCHPSKQTAGEIRVPSTGHGSLAGERSGHKLARSVCLRLPTMGHPQSSATKSPAGPGRPDTGSPVLGGQTVVPVTAGSVGGGTDKVPRDTRPAHSASLRSEAQSAENVKPTCMESIGSSMQQQGFSGSVASRVAKAVRRSSRRIYDHKWKLFLKWCAQNQIPNPEQASVQSITSFLNWLFETKELEVSTIRGYRAAICRVIKFTSGLDYSDNHVLNALFRNFSLERPVTKSKFPKWDLIIVLKALSKAPYEPLCAASDLFVAKKTLFLLALASGARRSELHSLDLDQTLLLDNDKSMQLRPTEDFIAKNCNPGTGSGRFMGFTITKLDTVTDIDSSVDNLLCPVRALLNYLKRTKKRRGNIKKVFITHQKKGLAKAANLNTLSSWLRHTIAEAYHTAPDSESPLLHRSLHEVRAVGASMARHCNISMEDILSQCRWAHQTTFTSFYLRDVKSQKDQLHQLSPLMAAGSVIGGAPAGVCHH